MYADVILLVIGDFEEIDNVQVEKGDNAEEKKSDFLIHVLHSEKSFSDSQFNLILFSNYFFLNFYSFKSNISALNGLDLRRFQPYKSKRNINCATHVYFVLELYKKIEYFS